jgi:hypothetical protein
MGSKSLREQALTELRRYGDQGPTLEDLNAIFVELREERNDRAVALIAACLVEDALEAAIATKCQHLNSDDHNRLFGADAPLGTLSSRIKMAYALGLCTREEQRNLDSMRVIRNAFAHVTRPLHFSTPVVTAVCDHLTLRADAKNGPHFARARYIWVMTDLTETLMKHVINRA